MRTERAAMHGGLEELQRLNDKATDANVQIYKVQNVIGVIVSLDNKWMLNFTVDCGIWKRRWELEPCYLMDMKLGLNQDPEAEAAHRYTEAQHNGSLATGYALWKRLPELIASHPNMRLLDVEMLEVVRELFNCDVPKNSAGNRCCFGFAQCCGSGARYNW
jgi:hypothetical protein